MLPQHFHKDEVDKAGIHALVERWCDITHTFHVLCGEFTLSPLHFSAITGLRVGGERIPFDVSIKDKPLYILCQLGFLLTGYEDGYAMYEQLRKDAFDRPCNTDDLSKWTSTPRCFLLYTIANAILRCGNHKVGVYILEALRDVNAISRYDWGGVALSHLYAHLDCIT
ncbi:hypothetical protein CDL15_Pgr010782 [Punica granatum]|uniref:Aminotransferase-like plant mobile domain-containing protein n=1 Tax=Punica granatum TaxID=22663 RepID=A0A218W4P2_PUNGR|nr:hypothetical protein CDL15_Pgr010782 [Punica granatum]